MFSNFHIILPNATKYANKFAKKIQLNEIEQVFEEEIQDCKDGSGLRLIFGQDQGCHSGEILHL